MELRSNHIRVAMTPKAQRIMASITQLLQQLGYEPPDFAPPGEEYTSWQYEFSVGARPTRYELDPLPSKEKQELYWKRAAEHAKLDKKLEDLAQRELFGISGAIYEDEEWEEDNNPAIPVNERWHYLVWTKE